MNSSTLSVMISTAWSRAARARCQRVHNTHVPLHSWQLKRNSHDGSSTAGASQPAARVSIISSRRRFRPSINSPVMNRELELSTLGSICQASGWASVRVRVIIGNDEECACRGQSSPSCRTSHTSANLAAQSLFHRASENCCSGLTNWGRKYIKKIDSGIKSGGYYLCHAQIQSLKEN